MIMLSSKASKTSKDISRRTKKQPSTRCKVLCILFATTLFIGVIAGGIVGIMIFSDSDETPETPETPVQEEQADPVPMTIQLMSRVNNEEGRRLASVEVGVCGGECSGKCSFVTCPAADGTDVVISASNNYDWFMILGTGYTDAFRECSMPGGAATPFRISNNGGLFVENRNNLTQRTTKELENLVEGMSKLGTYAGVIGGNPDAIKTLEDLLDGTDKDFTRTCRTSQGQRYESYIEGGDHYSCGLQYLDITGGFPGKACERLQTADKIPEALKFFSSDVSDDRLTNITKACQHPLGRLDMYPILRELVTAQIYNTWLNLSMTLPLQDSGSSSFTLDNIQFLNEVQLSGGDCTAYMTVKIGNPSCEEQVLPFNATLLPIHSPNDRIEDNIREHYKLERWGFRYSSALGIWYSNIMNENDCAFGCCDDCFQTYCEHLENSNYFDRTKMWFPPGSCGKYPSGDGLTKPMHRRQNGLHVYHYNCSYVDDDVDPYYASSAAQTCNAPSRTLVDNNYTADDVEFPLTYCVGGFSTQDLAEKWCADGDIKDNNGQSALRNGKQPTKARPMCTSGCKYEQDYATAFNIHIHGVWTAGDDILYNTLTDHRKYRTRGESDCIARQLPDDVQLVTQGPLGENILEANKYFSAQNASEYFTSWFKAQNETLYDWQSVQDELWFRFTSPMADTLWNPELKPHVVIIDADIDPANSQYNEADHADITRHRHYACQRMLPLHDTRYYQQVQRKRC